MPNQTTTQPISARQPRRMGRLGSVLGGLVLAGTAAVSLGARAYDVGVTAPHSQPVERVLRGGWRFPSAIMPGM